MSLKEKLPPLSQLGPFIALAVACVVFGVTTDNFFTAANFALILQQVMVVGVIAIGQTLIILTAGIDLSCGMVMALGSIIRPSSPQTLACRPRWPSSAALP